MFWFGQVDPGRSFFFSVFKSCFFLALSLSFCPNLLPHWVDTPFSGRSLLLGGEKGRGGKDPGPGFGSGVYPHAATSCCMRRCISLGRFPALHKGNRSTSRARMFGSVTCDGPTGDTVTSVAVPASPTPRGHQTYSSFSLKRQSRLKNGRVFEGCRWVRHGQEPREVS